MKIRLVLAAALVFFGASALTAGDGSAPVLVTPEWLAVHLNDPGLVVLNVAQNARSYRSGHVPGARFLWVTSIAASDPELSFQLVPLPQLVKVMDSLGVSNNSRVILCGVGGNVSATARAYVTLEYLGMGDRTSILSGGFEGWKKAGNPVSTEAAPRARGKFTPKLHRDAIVDAGYVKSHLDRGDMTILDARGPEFYSGKNSGGYPRAGHIPGALNLYYTALFDTTNSYLPVDSLKAKFAAAGIKPGDEIITYCHVGQTACSDYVGAKILGYKVHLYDGSFEDWSGREDLPLTIEGKSDPQKPPFH